MTETALVQSVEDASRRIEELVSILAVLASLFAAIWKHLQAMNSNAALVAVVKGVEAATGECLDDQDAAAVKATIKKAAEECGIFKEVDRVVQETIHGGELSKAHTKTETP